MIKILFSSSVNAYLRANVSMPALGGGHGLVIMIFYMAPPVWSIMIFDGQGDARQ
jgi:hypothetical protein